MSIFDREFPEFQPCTAPTLSFPVRRIYLPESPSAIEHLAHHLRSFGYTAQVHDIGQSSERTFGILGRVVLNGLDCTAKIAGPQYSADNHEYPTCSLRHRAVQQERDGLLLAWGKAPQLLCELVVNETLVGILREYMPGKPLLEAISSNEIDESDARHKAMALGRALAAEELWLWDPEPRNLWLRPDGSVMIIEGHCVTSSSLEPDELAERNQGVIQAMFDSRQE